MSAPDDEEVDLDDDAPGDEEDADEAPPAPPRRARRSRRRGRPRPVRPWTVADLDTEEDETDTTEDEEEKTGGIRGFFRNLRGPVYFRARDSWYFEPLVALMIIVVLLVSLFAYTSNWPPIYVVESGSMQHGTGDLVGLINTGDLVLVKQVPSSTVVPYTLGEQTGYSTYGEYGDVILYHPNGDTGATPVIHRVLLYLVWDATSQGYSAPALAGLPCGSQPNAAYSVSGVPSGCGSTGLNTAITLYHVGWRDASVSITLGSLGHYSGFITMGDNNIYSGSPNQGETDQSLGISGLVAGGWVIGVARGMVPWVGSFKLLVDGNAGLVPAQSWQYLALTLSAIVLAGFGLHYLFRVEGIEDPRRLAEEKAEAEERDDEEEEGPQWEEHPKGSRWKGLRAWLASPEEEEEPAAPPRKHGKHRPPASAPKPTPKTKTRGRPRPAVRKSKGFFHRRPERRSSKDSEDDSL